MLNFAALLAVELSGSGGAVWCASKSYVARRAPTRTRHLARHPRHLSNKGTHVPFIARITELLCYAITLITNCMIYIL